MEAHFPYSEIADISSETEESSDRLSEIDKSGWINKLLLTRLIFSKIGNSNVISAAKRGTPQGGVLSPLLWLIVINKILTWKRTI